MAEQKLARRLTEWALHHAAWDLTGANILDWTRERAGRIVRKTLGAGMISTALGWVLRHFGVIFPWVLVLAGIIFTAVLFLWDRAVGVYAKPKAEKPERATESHPSKGFPHEATVATHFIVDDASKPLIVITDGGSGLLLSNLGMPAFGLQISNISNGRQCASFQPVPQLIRGRSGQLVEPRVTSLDVHYTAGSFHDAVPYEPDTASFFVLYRGYRDTTDTRANFTISRSCIDESVTITFGGLGKSTGDRHAPILAYKGLNTAGPWAFCVPLNRCFLQVLTIENIQVAVENVARNVRADIDYRHSDGVDRLCVKDAAWINTNPMGSNSPGSNIVNALSLSGDESQRLVVMMQREGDNAVIASMDRTDFYETLKVGHWDATIEIKADNAETLWLEGGFTVYPDNRLVFDRPAFQVKRP
jgi:hypothetical protein